MLVSELIKTLQNKIDNYWDAKINVIESYWRWDYKTYDIDSVLHNWENWLQINIK